MTTTLTATELSAIAELTERRLRQLAAEGHFPAPRRGVYDLTPTIQGLLRYYRNAPRHGGEAMEAERLRLVKEQADAQALKNAITRRELLPVPAVQSHLAAVQIVLKGGIMNSNLMKEEKADLLNELRRLGESVNVPDDDDGDTDTTAELTPGDK